MGFSGHSGEGLHSWHCGRRLSPLPLWCFTTECWPPACSARSASARPWAERLEICLTTYDEEQSSILSRLDGGQHSTWPTRQLSWAPALYCCRFAERTMRRILFSWNGLEIYSYPAMLYLGMVAGVFAGAHVAQFSGLDPNSFVLANVILIVPALVGA